MTKRTVFLHVGPTVAGPGALRTALYGDPSLAAAGVKLPTVGQHLLDDADLEIRRRHSDVGLRRKDVEGSWAKVCRAACKANWIAGSLACIGPKGSRRGSRSRLP